MNKFDQQVLNALQKEFPICERPYQVIARGLGCTEAEVFDSVQGMLDSGVIRRMGASLDSRKLGYASTLAAVQVDQACFDQACEVINAYPEVTHCYERSHAFNIWFTLNARDQARIEAIMTYISDTLGLTPDQWLNVPVERLFKLNASFVKR